MKKRWIALVMTAVMSVPIGLLAAGTQNKVTYDMNNTPISGTYKEPSKSGAKFLGWATTKEKADAGTVDFHATPENKTNTSLNAVSAGQTKTVYAVWQEGNAKYAVALYGIDQDTEKMGGGTYTHTMTFGPATGGDYVTTSKAAHIALSAETDSDKCIHNHSWNEVIAFCKTNPHVFDKCVEAGCTKTVNLDINDTLKGGGWKDDYLSKETGDGPSLLFNELHDEFRIWQPGTESGELYECGDNTGGYPASRIRAVLNGYDWTSDSSHGNTTDLTRANQKYVYTRSDESAGNNTGWDGRTADLADISTVMSDNCLLSCFPENLQKAIVPKAVRSDTVYDDITGNNVTTWDKLWLFSGKEIYGASSDNDDNRVNRVIRPNEGTIYDRIREKNITTSTYAGNKGYCLDTSGSTASGGDMLWWLRSTSLFGGGDSKFQAYCVCDDVNFGGWFFPATGYGIAVAPGFVIGQ